MRDNTNDLIGFKYNDNIYYYIKNAQNDIIGILDNNYNIVAKYKYNSWGINIKITDGIGNNVQNNLNHIANINPFRYRSYYYDTETKLYYLNSRYYNPLWGRFLNSDNIFIQNNNLLGNNIYLYCDNNPINLNDTKGHGPILNFIKKNIVNPIERFFGKIGSTVAGFFMGAPTASKLLNHSLQSNPKNLYYGNDSKIANKIKKSDDFTNTMHDIALFNPDKKFDNYYEPLSFNDRDLKLGLHNCSMFINGELKNGTGNLSITIIDKYDFDYAEYSLDSFSSIKSWPTNFINNFAWVQQEDGVINNYYIYIDFDYCVNCK